MLQLDPVMRSLPICYVTPKHMGPVMHSLRILLPLNLEFSGWTLFDAIYESATPKLGIIECSSWTLLCAASVTPKCCRWTLLAQFTHLLRLRNAPVGPCYAQFTHLLRLNAPSSWTLLCTVYALASATPKLGMLHLDPVMHSLSICYAAPVGPYIMHSLRICYA